MSKLTNEIAKKKLSPSKDPNNLLEDGKQNNWWNRKPKEETLKHLEVFEIYYAMGDSRTLKTLSDIVGIRHATMEQWSGHFKWQERVKERDQELIKRIQTDFQDEILRYRSFYIDLVKGMIADTITVDPKTGKPTCSVKPNNVSDLEKLVKMHLSLMGDNGAPPAQGQGGGGNMTVQIVVPQQLEMGKWSDMVRGGTPQPLTFPIDRVIEDADCSSSK